MPTSNELLPLPLPFLPEAVIFDCDGTLIDTMPLHFKAWQETLGEQAGLFPEETFYAWGGVTAREIVMRINQIHGTSLPDEALAEDKEQRYHFLIPQATVIPLVVAEVKRFHAAGIPMGVASGGMRSVVEESLRVTGLRDYFGAVATADDVVHGKPAPDVFLLAAKRLGVAPETCVVYEDGDTGLEAARRAGMRGVDIRPFLPPRVTKAL
jgi:beta-phosphoglucomutase family hydrolase